MSALCKNDNAKEQNGIAFNLPVVADERSSIEEVGDAAITKVKVFISFFLGSYLPVVLRDVLERPEQVPHHLLLPRGGALTVAQVLEEGDVALRKYKVFKRVHIDLA